jgi:hypothetical protein
MDTQPTPQEVAAEQIRADLTDCWHLARAAHYAVRGSFNAATLADANKALEGALARLCDAAGLLAKHVDTATAGASTYTGRGWRVVAANAKNPLTDPLVELMASVGRMQDWDSTTRVGRALLECEAALNERRVCPGCQQIIDPETCGCGDSEKGHGYGSGHPFVAMGCDCLRVKS